MIETDSWIDVSSQPSDSYTSSSDDHIITAGLRISQARRKRRGTARPASRPQEPEPDSSDEDDNEGEGEDMGSLIHSMTMSSDGYSSPDDDDEESDDEASASDTNGKVFSSSQRPGVPYRRQTTPMASSSYNRGHAYSGYNSFAPNHATDHDAALRASLSTLLSCAAAARGLPKSSQSQTSPGSQSQHQQGGRVAVDSLTLVREGGEPSSSTNSGAGKSRSLSITSNATTTSASRSPSSDQLAQTRTGKSSSAERKRSSGAKSSKSRRRSRTRTRDITEEGDMSLSNMSYMTLAISAGAIVVLSALTFSAGYALGREAGKGEGGLLSSVSRTAESGRAVVKGTGRGIRIGTRFSSVAAF